MTPHRIPIQAKTPLRGGTFTGVICKGCNKAFESWRRNCPHCEKDRLAK